MTVGVCFKSEQRGWMQDQWSWVFSNFGIRQIWERDKPENDDCRIYQESVAINSAAELPNAPALVVVNPQDARFIKGDESLKDFVHPENAIYLFGGTQAVLSDEDLGGVKPDSIVYIPTVKHECYSHAAGYMVMWDRYVKRGEFG